MSYHLLYINCFSASSVFVHFTVLAPEFIISFTGFFAFNDMFLIFERFAVNQVVKSVVRIEHFTSSVNTVNEIVKLELGCYAFVNKYSVIQTVTIEFLLQIHVFHKVQINFVRNIHLDPFYKM